MKFKFLSFVMASVVAVGFTACDTKNTTEASAEASSVSASASEQVEEEKALEPTGNAAADAKQAAEEMIAFMNKDFTVEDMENIDKDIDALQAKYEDFYKAKGDAALKKFQNELEKLEKDPEFAKRIEEAKKKFEEKALDLVKKANETVEEVAKETEKAATE